MGLWDVFGLGFGPNVVLTSLINRNKTSVPAGPVSIQLNLCISLFMTALLLFEQHL